MSFPSGNDTTSTTSDEWQLSNNVNGALLTRSDAGESSASVNGASLTRSDAGESSASVEQAASVPIHVIRQMATTSNGDILSNLMLQSATSTLFGGAILQQQQQRQQTGMMPPANVPVPNLQSLPAQLQIRFVGNSTNYAPPQPPYNNQFLSQPGQQMTPYPVMSIPQSAHATGEGAVSFSNHQSPAGGFMLPQMTLTLARQSPLPLNVLSQANIEGEGSFHGSNPYGGAGQQYQQQHNNMAAANTGLHPMHYQQSVPPTYLNAHQLGAGSGSNSVAYAFQALQMHAAASAAPAGGNHLPSPHGIAPALPTQSASLCIRISLSYDHERLSPYQCLAREQMECFSASQDDVEAYARGRNKQIMIGQAGIRCIHCKHLPMQDRGRGSVYFPGRLLFLYQAAQNLGSCHLCESCPAIPQETKRKLQDLHANKTTTGGGKIYWAEAAAVIGLTDTENGIRFSSHALSASQVTSS